MTETYTAAILTINRPSTMTKKGKRNIADWLRKQADDLEKYGDSYSKKKFQARYLY